MSAFSRGVTVGGFPSEALRRRRTMARIRKWKETLVLACAALLFSLARVWPLGTHDGADRHRQGHSLLVTGINHKPSFGVELMAGRPYIRLARASLVPIAMPMAARAFVAMAAPLPAAPPGPRPETTTTANPATSCHACNTATAPCCSATSSTCCQECRVCHTYLCVCETSGTITGYYETCNTGYRSWTCFHECG